MGAEADTGGRSSPHARTVAIERALERVLREYHKANGGGDLKVTTWLDEALRHFALLASGERQVDTPAGERPSAGTTG